MMFIQFYFNTFGERNRKTSSKANKFMSTGGKYYGIMFQYSGFVRIDSDVFTLHCQLESQCRK